MKSRTKSDIIVRNASSLIQLISYPLIFRELYSIWIFVTDSNQTQDSNYLALRFYMISSLILLNFSIFAFSILLANKNASSQRP